MDAKSTVSNRMVANSTATIWLPFCYWWSGSQIDSNDFATKPVCICNGNGCQIHSIQWNGSQFDSNGLATVLLLVQW